MFWKKSPESQVEDKIIKAFKGYRGKVSVKGRDIELERGNYISITSGFDVYFINKHMDINVFCWICDNIEEIIETINRGIHEHEIKKQKEKERRQKCLDKCLEKLK